MIHGLTNKDFVLEVLSDYKPHFSREFVTGPGGEALLLDYRKRISELRAQGKDIRPLWIKDSYGNKRPGYQLHRPLDDQTLFDST